MRRGRAEGAGKKSEVVTVRLDPKLKYLAELAARKHRRPLSSYIEWAVEQSLSRVWLDEPFNGEVYPSPMLSGTNTFGTWMSQIGWCGSRLTTRTC